MLVVVVVSVLAAIAIPSYDLFVKRSRRSEARAALSDLAAMQEQYFLDNKRYAPTLDDVRDPRWQQAAARLLVAPLLSVEHRRPIRPGTSAT